MPFKDLPEGQTHYCEACEWEERGRFLPGKKHTCGRQDVIGHIGGAAGMSKKNKKALPSWSELPEKEKREIVSGAAGEANQEQRELVQEALPGWEEGFDKKFKGYWKGRAIPDEIKFFIRQIIKAEREQAVKEAYQSPEFTDVFEFGKKQAVKEVIEEIEKGLPVVEGIIGSTEEVKFGFSACLARINEFINELKAKYDKA